MSEENQEEILDVRVKHIMTRNPLTVEASSTLEAAARGMESCGCGCCLVESQGKIVGIITERDIVRRVASKGLSLKRTKVSSVMTTPIIVINHEATVEEALKIMEKHGIRRLPVVDEEGLVGIISITDVARALAEKAGYTNTLINVLARQFREPEGVYV